MPAQAGMTANWCFREPLKGEGMANQQSESDNEAPGIQLAHAAQGTHGEQPRFKTAGSDNSPESGNFAGAFSHVAVELPASGARPTVSRGSWCILSAVLGATW